MNIYPPTDDSIQKAAAVLRGGGLVSFPTETVYGLGANAFNAGAVARIFEVKARPRFDPIIVHIAEAAALRELTAGPSPEAEALMKAFWPGPLTLVLPRSERVPLIVTAGLQTVAVRMPAHDVALRLIREAGTPVAAPSANPFGALSPTDAAHVAMQLGGSIDMIIDGGPCAIGVESTIIKVEERRLVLLRPGGLPVEEIERVAGRVHIHDTAAPGAPEAPGQMPSHYAPKTPLRIVSRPENGDAGSENTGLLSYRGYAGSIHYRVVEVLSEKGDLREAASRLFACLHRLDSAGLDCILAEAVPETGLGRAIMNRLRKAESR